MIDMECELSMFYHGEDAAIESMCNTKYQKLGWLYKIIS